VHEYSIVQALVERVEAEAAAHRATSVTAVFVRIGELSGVDVELLTTAFRTVAERTICERSALAVATVPVRWACRACGRTVETGGPLRCDACGAAAALLEGDEIMLERIEMDVEVEGEETTDVRAGRL
jgi:hydrogenase nickel incorporation protein HypA/HybF